MNYNSGLTKILRKRLDKTKEARQGDPLVKRRNNRENRSLMKLNTYLKLYQEDDLKKFTNGYVVYLRPDEYFDSVTNNRKSSLHKSLVLGKNCIIYYQNISDWNKYSPIGRNWKQVVENTTLKDDWSGEFAVNIPNSDPQKLRFIVRTNETKYNQSFSWMNNEMKNVKERVTSSRESLGGKGLGNYEYDFCTSKEQENVCYQLAYLIWNTKGMIDLLVKEATEKIDSWDNSLDKRKILTLGAVEYFHQCKQHVIDYCKSNKLIDESKLVKIGSITEDTKLTSCPLCKSEIDAYKFFEKVVQDEGRESEQNTITEIVLMHIDPLIPGKLNHHSYNLGWGHHDCNTFQGNKSISDTIKRLKVILEKHHSI